MAPTVPRAVPPVLPLVPMPRTAPGEEGWASWYEGVLGWPVAGGTPLRLLTGVRYDVLAVPSDAGAELLRGPVATGPVALVGGRALFLVAPGAAEELEGLLDWLEWGGVDLDLAALGAGGRITAPAPPGRAAAGRPRGAAVWLRPPEPGCGAELPALPGPGRVAGPDLVRLVAAAATQCHRARLRRRTPVRSASGQPLAFS